MTKGALVVFGNSLSGLIHGALENRFSAFLRRCEFAILQPIPVRAEGLRHDERHQVREFLVVVTLRAIEVLFGAGAALGRHIRVAAVPFERLSSGEVLEQFVVHDVFAEAVRLEVPFEAIKGAVDMTIRATEVSLETELRGVEYLLAATNRSDLLRSAEVDC